MGCAGDGGRIVVVFLFLGQDFFFVLFFLRRVFLFYFSPKNSYVGEKSACRV